MIILVSVFTMKIPECPWPVGYKLRSTNYTDVGIVQNFQVLTSGDYKQIVHLFNDEDESIFESSAFATVKVDGKYKFWVKFICFKYLLFTFNQQNSSLFGRKSLQPSQIELIDRAHRPNYFIRSIQTCKFRKQNKNIFLQPLDFCFKSH